MVALAMAGTQLPGDPDMVARPNQPVGYFDERSGKWLLAVAWLCELSNGQALLVHPMAQSDGASIPPALWPFVGPRFNAATFPAAFCHDMLYAAELVSRSQADYEFRRLLKLFGVSTIKATAYWLAVRAFGWIVWREHTTDSVASSRLYAEIIES